MRFYPFSYSYHHVMFFYHTILDRSMFLFSKAHSKLSIKCINRIMFRSPPMSNSKERKTLLETDKRMILSCEQEGKLEILSSRGKTKKSTSRNVTISYRLRLFCFQILDCNSHGNCLKLNWMDIKFMFFCCYVVIKYVYKLNGLEHP